MPTNEPEAAASPLPSGILLVDKPAGRTSFTLVSALRRLLKVKKIGHAGTLDPFATGVMVMLIGKEFTKLSDQLLCQDKEYLATMRLGIETDSYDCDGQVVATLDYVPTQAEITEALLKFQGEVLQTPPMFSAKKKDGKKLYELARKGIVIDRKPVQVTIRVEFIRYDYPFVELKIACSKGTYVRSIAHDLGQALKTGAHLTALRRTRSGNFKIDDCIDGSVLFSPDCDITKVQAAMQKIGPSHKI